MSDNPRAGAMWNDDAQLFELCRTELFTSVVGDVMDQRGLRRQFLPPAVRPLREGMTLAGRAMTVLEADCFEPVAERDTSEVMQQPFGRMLEALDDLKPGEVYLCSGASPTYALWGELMSTRALKLGAAGAVVNGYSRDTHGVVRAGLPVFSYGPYAQDQNPRGKVIDWRCPLRVGEVLIESGDLVIGDIDGVCIVPRAHESSVIQAALEKARGERTVLKALQQGTSATEAFEHYGIM